MLDTAEVSRLLRLNDAATELARRATSFHAATRFFPRDDRAAIETLYRFCRAVDDLADDPSIPDADALAGLDQIHIWLSSGLHREMRADTALAPFQQLVTTRALDVRLMRCLVEGVRSDRLVRERASWDDLRHYCFQVAGSVGMLLTELLGTREAQACAATLGIAMQLTNILRDVGEDLERGIIYLPSSELAHFGYSRARLEREVVDADFVALMRWQIDRARRHYAAGLAGLPWLSPSARFPISLAARLYSGILDEIEANGYDVFRRRASTSLPRKVQLALATGVGLHLSGWLGNGAWPCGGNTLAGVAHTVRRELDREVLAGMAGDGGLS